MKQITRAQRQTFMEILIRMGYTKKEVFDVCHLVEIPEAMLRVVSVLQERDYKIPFEELLKIAQKIETDVITEMPDEG